MGRVSDEREGGGLEGTRRPVVGVSAKALLTTGIPCDDRVPFILVFALCPLYLLMIIQKLLPFVPCILDRVQGLMVRCCFCLQYVDDVFIIYVFTVLRLCNLLLISSSFSFLPYKAVPFV